MINIDVAQLIMLQNNKIVFKVWHSIPGPGEDDFICYYDEISAANKAIIDYLYSGPTVINEWIFPYHQHPELHLEDIRCVLANVVNVSLETFKGIAERRKERIERYYWLHRNSADNWEKATQYQFLSIAHSTNESISLRLRRDMQEAYIVHLNNS